MSLWLSLIQFGQFTSYFLIMEIISALPLSFPFRQQVLECILYLIISLLRQRRIWNLPLVRTYIFSFIGFLHKYCFSQKLLSTLSAKNTALSLCFYINLIQLNTCQYKLSFLSFCISILVSVYLHLRYASFKLQLYHAKKD